VAEQNNIDILITKTQPLAEIIEILTGNDIALINTSASKP